MACAVDVEEIRKCIESIVAADILISRLIETINKMTIADQNFDAFELQSELQYWKAHRSACKKRLKEANFGGLPV
jgi:hypothetical protein